MLGVRFAEEYRTFCSVMPHCVATSVTYGSVRPNCELLVGLQRAAHCKNAAQRTRLSSRSTRRAAALLHAAAPAACRGMRRPYRTWGVGSAREAGKGATGPYAGLGRRKYPRPQPQPRPWPLPLPWPLFLTAPSLGPVSTPVPSHRRRAAGSDGRGRRARRGPACPRTR